MSAFPAVGTLYLGFNRNGMPVWSQPGGPGTLVFPQLPQVFPWFGAVGQFGGLYEWPMDEPAQYYFACGHPLNCPEIYSEYNADEGTQYALIVCPMCSYIQQVMPLAQYQSYIDTPIVVA